MAKLDSMNIIVKVLISLVVIHTRWHFALNRDMELTTIDH